MIQCETLMIRLVVPVLALVWFSASLPLEAQSVYTVQLRAADNAISSCNVDRRERSNPGSGSPASRDTLRVRVIGSDPSTEVAAPSTLKVYLNAAPIGTLEQGKTRLEIDRDQGSLARTAVLILPAGGGEPVCNELLAGGGSAQTQEPEAEPSFSFIYGAEVSSATGFDQSKTRPAIGVAWNFPALQTPVGILRLTTTADYTQAASVREFRSCRRVPIRIGPDTLRGGPRVGESCGPAEQVGDTIFRTAVATDSLRFSPVGVWRAFAVGRLEADLDPSDEERFRIGVAGSVGFQTNPSGLSDMRQQTIRPIWLVGPSLRVLDDNLDERFAIDVLYGTVQNYAQRDRLVRDSTLRFEPEPLPLRTTQQWQVRLLLRPFQGALIRGFVTFNAPPPEEFGDTPVPDIARIAFLFDRSFARIFTALVPNPGQ